MDFQPNLGMQILKKYAGLHENGGKKVKMAIQNGGHQIFQKFFLLPSKQEKYAWITIYTSIWYIMKVATNEGTLSLKRITGCSSIIRIFSVLAIISTLFFVWYFAFAEVHTLQTGSFASISLVFWNFVCSCKLSNLGKPLELDLN